LIQEYPPGTSPFIDGRLDARNVQREFCVCCWVPDLERMINCAGCIWKVSWEFLLDERPPETHHLEFDRPYSLLDSDATVKD